MTVGNVYEGNLIEDFLIDIERYDENHYAKILKNGVELTSGLLEQEMMVQVYHGDELYGAYTVDELLTPYPQTNSLLRSSNSYGFILPIDGTILKDSPAGNITSHFGYRNGENHLGIDIADFPLTDKYYYSLGRPIRAVKSGTVIRSRYEEGGYGHYVYIDHGEGLRTLYAHMQYTPLVSLNQYVEQGDIIGHVGASGGVTGVHLHFEVIENGKEVNPIPYLTGASTYNPTPITYTVTYNANGGTSAPSAQTKTHGVPMTLSNLKPIRDGYEFYGWATSPTATTPTYQSGSSYTANENITLYAVWAIPKVEGIPNINRTYGAYCLGNSIEFGIRNNIMEGEYIISPNGKYIAIMQGDGNFVVYNADTYLWASGTQATLGKGNFVQINPDGNIVIYHSEDISKHKLLAQGAKKLSITDSGVLEAFNSVGNVVWSSESRGLYPHDTFTFDYIVKVEDKNISQLNRTNGKYCVGSALTTDMRLNVNEYLASPNGEFIAVMQRDGNFVVYNKERYLWATGTAGSIHEEYYLVVQGDGNIVLYDDTLPEGEKAQWNLWGMIPSTNKAVRLELENDGRLVARNNYTGNTPKGDAIWVSRPGGYPYGRPDSVKFDIMYKYNVDLNIDKNPFGLELEYSITDGTNTYKSNANGEISIPNTTNANYKALIYEVGSENPFCSIDLTPGNYKHSTLGAEHPYEINVEKVSEYKTQMTISYYNYGDINLNSKLDTEDISLLTAYLLSGYNFIQTGSSNDLILGKSGSNITINGDISANGDFKLWKNNANINGVLSAKNY